MLTDKEQKELLSNYFLLLRLVEDLALERDDIILKQHVECFYRQWNRITGSKFNPVWRQKESA